MDIAQEIKDAVAKHLPQALGTALQERLQQAEKDAIELKKAQANITELRRDLEGAKRTIDQQIARIERNGDLDKREKSISDRERAAEIKELNFKLDAAHANTQFARDVAIGLVRNTEYRNSVFENKSESTPIFAPGQTYPSGTANSGSTNNRTDTKTAA